MISLSTPTFDLSGNVVFAESARTNFGNLARRASRTATVDGGAFISDLGFTHGDRTFSVVVEDVCRDLVEAIGYLVETYSTLMLSCIDGLFLGTLESVSVVGGAMRLSFLVSAKLTED